MLASWGQLPHPGVEVRSEDLARITEDAVLSRGLGRSYGDSALPPAGTLKVATTTLADRILAFDEDTGRMRVEAGVSLDDIIWTLLPRGWFVPVTPGTAYVTVGGMVASDVHGKNHHVDGCFGEHCTALRMRLASGEIVECGPQPGDQPELFWATVGGMGLTGHILEVEFTMKRVASPWIWAENIRVRDVDEYVDVLKSSARDWPYTVGWIDCVSRGRKLGRGILSRGRFATAEEAPSSPPIPKRRLTFPFRLPSFAINPLTVRAFNAMYYRKPTKGGRGHVEHPSGFFHPLDAIRNWNRAYGRAGFTQYQCVLPESAGRGAARRFLEVVTRFGGASPLCVIKDCGPQGPGVLSFPMRGMSVAIDFPVRRNTQGLIDALNEFVLGEGGRIYLTKDAFTRAEHFAAMEPRLERFNEIRRRYDPEGRLCSRQSVRMLGDTPPKALPAAPSSPLSLAAARDRAVG